MPEATWTSPAQLGRIKASPAQVLVEWSRYTEGALRRQAIRPNEHDVAAFRLRRRRIAEVYRTRRRCGQRRVLHTHYSSATTANIPAAQKFIGKIKQAYGKVADAYHAEAYDAITMALLAIEQAGSEDRGKIRDALSKVSFDSTRGPFKFDEKGDPLLVTHVVKIETARRRTAATFPSKNKISVNCAHVTVMCARPIC